MTEFASIYMKQITVKSSSKFWYITDMEPPSEQEMPSLPNVETVLNEIYTRLDNTRRTGLDITPKKGGGSSPFRLEDEAPQDKMDELRQQLLGIIPRARQDGQEINLDGVPLKELVKGNLKIKTPIEGNEESRNKLLADVVLQLKDDKSRQFELRYLNEGEIGNFSLEVTFPDDPDNDEYEGLEYVSYDTVKGFNAEDFTIAKYVAEQASDAL